MCAINGTASDKRINSRGVPQGHVVGSTLFCIHINGITSTADRSSMFLCADDTEVHRSGSDLLRW